MRLAASLVMAVVLMAVLVLATPEENPHRILVMLGGTMPEGLIQGVTYFLFFFGMLEVLELRRRLVHEGDAFEAHLLPEKENYIISCEDANQIKLSMQRLERSQRFLLTDLIVKACTKYRLGKSTSEVLALTETEVKPVIGIAASLGFANEASTPEGIEKVTGMLAVAFDTTLVALVLSIVLMFLIHDLHKRQDRLFVRMSNYVIDNLVNRFYK